MIQKCPKCGAWVTASKLNFIERGQAEMENQVINGMINGNEIGKKTGSKFLESIGSGFGGISGLYKGLLTGTVEAFWGEEYHFVCHNCKYCWTENCIDSDMTEQFNYEQQIDECISDFNKFKDGQNSDRQNFYNRVASLFHNIYAEKYRLLLLCLKAITLFTYLHESEKALECIKEALSLDSTNPNAHFIKGLIMGEGRNVLDKYEILQELVYCKKIDHARFMTKDEMLFKLTNLASDFSRGFLSIPYQQRRFLVTCADLNFLPESFKVLPINDLPTDMMFPSGHPQENVLYVCHPYSQNYYLPYDSYSLELFRDEIDEYIRIMEHIGAKSICFSDMKEHENETKMNRKDNYGGGADVKYKGDYSGKFEYGQEQSREKYYKVRSELFNKRVYECNGTMSFPTNLVWYNHRKKWQDDYESRMAGRLSECSTIFKTSTNKFASDTERSKIEAELSILCVSANGSADNMKSISLKESEIYEWKLDIEFYPLSRYASKSNDKRIISTTNQSNNLKLIILLIAASIVVGLVLTLFL